MKAYAYAEHAATCLLFALSGAFEKFWFWTIVYARYYATEESLARSLGALVSTAGEVLSAALLAVGLAAAGVFVLVRDPTWRPARAFVLLFAACGVLAAATGFHFRRQYFVLLLPAVALLAGVAVDAAARSLQPRSPWLRVARYIASRAVERDRLAVIGSEPELYFYAGRPAATGYV